MSIVDGKLDVSDDDMSAETLTALGDETGLEHLLSVHDNCILSSFHGTGVPLRYGSSTVPLSNG